MTEAVARPSESARSPDPPDAVTTLPPESADAAADGVRLAELAASLPLSRASVFEIIKVLGVTTAKGPGPGGRGRVAWLSPADAARVEAAAHAVHRGEVRIQDLSLPSRPSRPTVSMTALRPASAVEAYLPDAGPFLDRLVAAERAVASGLGLTTREAAWILGVHPSGGMVERGGIRATRTGYNCWRLERFGSASGS